jgi:hypothetical protein
MFGYLVLRPVRALAPPGREQASIQHGRLALSGSKINPCPFRLGLTFPFHGHTSRFLLGFRLF